MTATSIALVALAVIVGLVGIVVPVLPGLLLVWGSVALWAGLQHHWWLLALVTITYAVGLVLQWALPGRRLRSAGVPTLSLVVGVLVGVVGAFVIPVVGALVGFVLGIYLAEAGRLRDARTAWPSTVHALRAIGLSMAIELSAALVISSTWVAWLLLVR